MGIIKNCRLFQSVKAIMHFRHTGNQVLFTCKKKGNENILKKDSREPLVSIVTSTFNSSRTAGRAIESVLGQTYSNIEYIIADGESSDNTLEIAESYRPQFEKRGFKYIILCSRDSGMYAGMNKGIEAASGKLVGMVNSDDCYEPQIVETAVEEYKKKKFDLFYADVNIIDENGRKLTEKKAKRMRYFFTTRHWNHPTTFVPKRIYNIRKYDETFQYYADWDFVLWIFKNSRNIAVINRPLSNFSLGGKTTRQGIRTLKKKYAERRQGYRNNGYSKLYSVECFFMEFVKEAVVRILSK